MSKEIEMSYGRSLQILVTHLIKNASKVPQPVLQGALDFENHSWRELPVETKRARLKEIAELTTKLADAQITPAKLRDAAKAYADTVAKAKASGVDPKEDDDEDSIKKAVVKAKMGDAAKDYTADHISIAFDALTKDVKVDAKDGVTPIGAPVVMGDGIADNVFALAGIKIKGA